MFDLRIFYRLFLTNRISFIICTEFISGVFYYLAAHLSLLLVKYLEKNSFYPYLSNIPVKSFDINDFFRHFAFDLRCQSSVSCTICFNWRNCFIGIALDISFLFAPSISEICMVVFVQVCLSVSISMFWRSDGGDVRRSFRFPTTFFHHFMNGTTHFHPQIWKLPSPLSVKSISQMKLSIAMLKTKVLPSRVFDVLQIQWSNLLSRMVKEYVCYIYNTHTHNYFSLFFSCQ